MKHEMRLDPIQFDEIYAGLKTVELRLNDEKRQKIHVDDTIQFYKRTECVKEVEVRLTELNKYKTIKDLVESTPITYFGPRFQNKQQLLNTTWNYSKEE